MVRNCRKPPRPYYPRRLREEGLLTALRNHLAGGALAVELTGEEVGPLSPEVELQANVSAFSDERERGTAFSAIDTCADGHRARRISAARPCARAPPSDRRTKPVPRD